MSEFCICRNCQKFLPKEEALRGRKCDNPNHFTCDFEKCAEITKSGGTKHDQEKPDYSLLSPLALEEIVKVMTFGKRKYTAHNWRGGIANSRLFAAAMRHLWAYWRGEDVDPESNLPHLAHAGCCVIMLLENTILRPKLDDRWRQE